LWKNYAGLTSSETTGLVSWWNLDETVGDNSTHVEDLVDTSLGSELITGFTDGTSYPFNTFTSSGRDISAAIETTGNFGGCASNALSITAGEVYKLTFNLTYTSGSNPLRAVLASNAIGAGTSQSVELLTTTNGVNTAYLLVATTDASANLQFGTWNLSDEINFSATDISLKKVGGNPGALK
jgi:hypothetical protein